MVHEEGECINSSTYLEATTSSAVVTVAVEESKPDDLVTRVVQPEKPVKPSGIEEEEMGPRERGHGGNGDSSVQSRT